MTSARARHDSVRPRPAGRWRLRAAVVGLAAVLGLGAVPALSAPPAAPTDAPAAAADAVLGVWTHAYASFGQPKYGRDFAHFAYVNPAAPKGGTLYLRNPDRRTSFDKFNYFTTKG